jgi:pimeloyl-ACP methyl ester carboxylesterase
LPKFCSKSATIASVQADHVEVQGARILVRRAGPEDGRPALYWHGGGGASEEVPEIVPPLAEAGWRVYAPDAPGYGGSERLDPGAYVASNIAGRATALLDELGLEQVVWIGYSWGGNIGMHTAVRSPGRIGALALLDGGYLVPQDDPDYNPSVTLEGREAALQAEVDAGESWDAPVDVIAAVMQGSNDEPVVPLLPEIEASGIPVLLVHSTEPPEYEELRRRALARFRAGLPSAEVVPVSASHGIFEDAGDDVRRILLDWLRREPRWGPG